MNDALDSDIQAGVNFGETAGLAYPSASTNNNIDAGFVACPDNIPPSVTCQNLTIIVESLNDVIHISSSDIVIDSLASCGIHSIKLSKDFFAGDELGAHSVVVTITDRGNRTSTCTAIVTLVPGTAIPTMSDWTHIILLFSMLIISSIFMRTKILYT